MTGPCDDTLADGASPGISVVIPCFDSARTLPALLEALGRPPAPTVPWEVVLADNGASDGLAAIHDSFAPLLPLRLVDATARTGTPAARNVGATHARHPTLLFLDADDLVRPGFVEAMHAAAGTSGMAAPRFDCDALNDGWSRWARSLPQERELGLDGHPWAYGTGLTIDRSLFRRLGGFDEDLTMGSEDIDLCWRAAAAGVTLRYEPSATLLYRFRRRRSDVLRQAYRYGRAYAQLLRRHPDHRRAPNRRVLVGSIRSLVSTDPHRRARAAYVLSNRGGQLHGRTIDALRGR